jgi:hypothetical protein
MSWPWKVVGWDGHACSGLILEKLLGSFYARLTAGWLRLWRIASVGLTATAMRLAVCR